MPLSMPRQQILCHVSNTTPQPTRVLRGQCGGEMTQMRVVLVVLVAVLLCSAAEAYRYGDIVPISVSMQANTVTGVRHRQSPSRSYV